MVQFYLHFQSTFISIVAIFIRLLKIFITCIVVVIGFNHGQCAWYYLSLSDLIMIYLSITLSISTIYDIIQWIEQDVTHLDDSFDANASEKDAKYQSCDEYMHCVALNVFWSLRVSFGWFIWDYRLINYVLLRQMMISCRLMQIIFVWFHDICIFKLRLSLYLLVFVDVDVWVKSGVFFCCVWMFWC